MGVVLTAFTKGNKQPQNSVFVINKSGNVLMKYSKVHTCDFADERNWEIAEALLCILVSVLCMLVVCTSTMESNCGRVTL